MNKTGLKREQLLALADNTIITLGEHGSRIYSNGTETKISSHPGHKPEWSPDGNSIVYGSGGGLVTVKPNGNRLTWILQKTSTWEFYSAYWSPRSDQLVFFGQSYESGVRNTDLFRIDANGNNLVQLTDTPATSEERTNDQSGGWR